MTLISLESRGGKYLIRFLGKKQHFNEYINKVMLLPEKEWNFEERCWQTPSSMKKYLEGLFKDIEYLEEVQEVESLSVQEWDDMGKSMKLQPYDYQKETIKFGLDTLEALIVLPCGSGKTPIGIGAYIEAKDRGIIKGPGMVVVKASLKFQWQKEIEKFSDLRPRVIRSPADITSNISNRIKSRKAKIAKLDRLRDKNVVKQIQAEIKDLEAEKKSLFKSQFEDCDLYVLNYESLTNKDIKAELHRRKIQFIFADEIHYVKNHKATRSEALREFKDTKMKLGATATPVGKNPEDLYGIFSFVAPLLFPTFSKFASTYIKYAGYGRVSGTKNQDHLVKKYAPHVMVKTKEEVSKMLPKLMVIQRSVEMTPDQREMNDRIMLELDEFKQQADTIRNSCKSEHEARSNPDLMKLDAMILALQTFAQELADAPELLTLSDSQMAKKYVCDDLSSPKLDMLKDLVSEILDSGEKVCIFSRYTGVQPILTRELQKLDKDMKFAYVSGKVNDQQRYREVHDKFRLDPNCKVLIMSDAGAEGLNLSACKYIIELDLAESYGIQTQRHGRIERSDSIHDTVFVYQILLEDSWDQIAMKIIEKKEGYDSSLIKVLAKERSELA